MTENRPLDDEARRRLEAVLAAYGADPARWPAADRQRLERFIAAGELAANETAEAREIDALLDRASRPVPPAGAVERLLAMARAGEGGERDNVVLFSRPAERRAAEQAPVIRRGGVAAIAALAASLVFGIYLGATGLAEGFLPRMLTGNGGESFSAELEMVDGAQQLFANEMEL